MKIKEKEIIGKGEWQTLAKWTVVLGDGSEMDWDVLEACDSAAVLAHDSGYIYLVSQPRPPMLEESSLELPAGRVDEGEEPLESAKRELKEETGIEAEDWNIISTFYSSPGSSRERVWLYEAEKLTFAKATPDQGEFVRVVKIPHEEIEDQIKTISDAKTLLGLLFLNSRKKEI